MTITEQHVKDSDKSMEIRIFSLNIWGIPNISKDRQGRVQAIAQYLSCVPEPYHYVFLQEVWSKDDYTLISDKVSKFLPYSHYFYSGVNGSGTCILSCSPINEVHFHPYSSNGYPHKIFHGDWYGGKGLALCKTTFKGIPLLLANTHLHAEYDYENYEYLHHRVVQAYETSQALRFAQTERHLSIFAGDLNCTSADVPYRLLTYNTGYVDTFVDCPTKPTDGVGATNETPSNSYTSVKSLKLDPNGKRIDYIFYFASPEYKVKTRAHDLPCPPRVPQTNYSYSDHEGVRAVITVKLKQGNQESEAATKDGTICFNRTDSLLDASAICTQGLRTVCKTQKLYSFSVAIFSILQISLLGVLFLEIPSGWRFCLNVLIIIIGVVIAFSLYMAIIFCNQEFNSVMATKQGLERLLDEVRQNNARYFEEQKKRALASKQ